MSRNKSILLVALVLVIVLGLAFVAQVRKLQTQLRSSVRIVPAESKSRQDLSGSGMNQDASLREPSRSAGKVSRRSFRRVQLAKSRGGWAIASRTR